MGPPSPGARALLLAIPEYEQTGFKGPERTSRPKALGSAKEGARAEWMAKGEGFWFRS